MQDGWGNGGEEMGMSNNQWDTEDGDMWNSPTSQESSSSCNSWGNGPKKGPTKVRMPLIYVIIMLADINRGNYCLLTTNVIVDRLNYKYLACVLSGEDG